MFSVVFVRHSVHGVGGINVTITHNALDLTVQPPASSPPPPRTSELGPPSLPPPPRHQTWNQPSHGPLLVASGGHHWRPAQTYSFEEDSMGMTSGGGY